MNISMETLDTSIVDTNQIIKGNKIRPDEYSIFDISKKDSVDVNKENIHHDRVQILSEKKKVVNKPANQKNLYYMSADKIPK